MAKSGEAAGLERATLDAYRQHLELHIVPLIGGVKLAQLTAPLVRSFEDRLRQDRSPAMVRKVLRSLGAIVADAQERGLVAQNVVHGLSHRRRGRERRAERRQNGRLKIGVDIPTPDEIKAIVAHLDGPRRPLLLTAIFAGLRASELRGLRWQDIDLKRGELHVRQRADRYGKVGRPKSEAGERTVPLPPMVVSVLREHKLACPNETSTISPSRIAAAASITASPSSSARSSRRKSRPVSSIGTARRSIRACTACATSMPRGASTGASTAGSNCR